MAIYLYGRNAVRSSLINQKVHKLYIHTNFRDQDILKLAKEAGIAVDICENNQLNSLTNQGKHQGVVALIDDFSYTSLTDLIAYSKTKHKPFILILAGIEDPHNLGAIARTVDAFNIDGIIIPKDRSVDVTPAALKVATCAFDYVRVSQVTNLNQSLNTLKDAGFWIVSADGSATQDYLDLDYEFPLALVIGSEGKGIPSLVLKNSDFRVKIPMNGHVNSLNASVATAVLIAGVIYKRNKL